MKPSLTNCKKTQVLLCFFCLLASFRPILAQEPGAKSFFVGGMMLFHAGRVDSRPFLLWQKSALVESNLYYFMLSSYSSRGANYRLLNRSIQAEEIGSQIARYRYTPVVDEMKYFPSVELD